MNLILLSFDGKPYPRTTPRPPTFITNELESEALTGSIDPKNSGILAYSIFFSDKKKNIIMDGVFSKILYSNQYFTMNGIYVLYRPLFCESSTEKTTPKYIESLCDIEKYILDIYANTILTLNDIPYEDGSSSLNIPRTPTSASPSVFTKSPIYVFKNQLCGGHHKTNISQGRTYGNSRTSIPYEDKSSSSLKATLCNPQPPTFPSELARNFWWRTRY